MKRNYKRLLSAVLVCAMLAGLFPSAALAANAGTDTASSSVSTETDSPVQITKTVTANEDGTYQLTMEAYVTKDVTVSTSTVPMDIVLVLDQSGSMGDDFDGNETNVAADKRITALKSAVTSFISTVQQNASENEVDHKIAIVGFASGSSSESSSAWSNTELLSTQDVVAYSSSGITAANYQDALVSANSNNTVNSRLTTAVSRIDANGATYGNYGLIMAKGVLDNRTETTYTKADGTTANRQTVVIFFTDGYPGRYATNDYFYDGDWRTNSKNTYNNIAVANRTIAAAAELKSSGAVIYSVGIFNGADPAAGYNFTEKSGSTTEGYWNQTTYTYTYYDTGAQAANAYMHFVSSDYDSSCTSMTSSDRTTPVNKGYYLAASNADALANVFSQIQSSIASNTVDADSTSVLSDTLTEMFGFSGVTVNDEGSVTGYTAQTFAVTGKGENGYTWAADGTDVSDDVTVTVEDKTINVTGFDYNENAVTATTQNGSTTYSGCKLVVSFTIQPDTNYTGWTGDADYNTNSAASLTYGSGTATDSTALSDSPVVPVSTHTVTYSWGDTPTGVVNANGEAVTLILPTDARHYIAGQAYAVDRTYTKDYTVYVRDENGNNKGWYTFSGWNSTGGTVSNADVTVTGNWTYTAATYTVTYKPGSNGTLTGANSDGNVVHDNVTYGTATPAAPEVTVVGDNYFTGWSPEVAETVTGDVIYTAQYAAQRIVTVTGDTQTVTYDGTEYSLAYTVSGLDADKYTLSVDYTGASGTNAGSYKGSFDAASLKITDASGADVTYQFAVALTAGELTITQRPITIKANDSSKVYDGTPLTLDGDDYEITSGSLVSGHVIASISITGSRTDVGESASTASGAVIQAGGTDVTANYAISYVPGKLTVTADDQATITVVAYNGVYDGQSHDGIASLTLKNGKGEEISTDGWTISYKADGKDYTSMPQFKDAGTHNIIVVATNTNYSTLTAESVTAQITPKKVILTSGDASKTYDGTELKNETVTVDEIDGFVTGEGATYTNFASITDVDTEKNTFSINFDDGTLAANYKIEYNYGMLTISPITTEIIITANSKSQVYNGTALTDGGYTYTENILVNGDVLTAVVEGTITNVGTKDNVVTSYKVMRGETDVTKNYTFGESVDGLLSVTARSVTLRSPNATKAYDGTPLMSSASDITADGFVEGEGVETYINFASITDVDTKKNTFEYGTLKDGTLPGNYTFSYVYGDLTVTQSTTAQMTVTGYNGMYDGAAHTVTVTPVEGSFVEGTVWTFQYSVDGGDYAGELPEYKDVCEHTITVKASNSNYTDVIESATVTITPRDVTLTSGTSSRPYNGQALSNNTVTESGSGFVTGEGAEYYDFASITDVDKVDNKFSYRLKEGTLESNYTITPVYGTLEITSYTTVLTITANSSSKVYDGTPLTSPGYTVNTDLLVTGDVLNVTVTGSQIDVGQGKNQVTSYTITRNGVDVTSNYANIKTVDGALEVTKKSLTLTSASDTKPYDGTPLTNKTVTSDAFAPGEGADYNVTGFQLDEGTNDNTFTYTAWSNTNLNNYEITEISGKLTVTAAQNEILVVANSDSKMYDGTPLTSSDYTVVGELVEGDELTAVVEGSITDYGTEANVVKSHTVQRGTADITANYGNVTYKNGTLSITKRSVTLTSATDSKEYDGTALTNYNVAVGGAGFVEGEGVTCNITGSLVNAGTSPNTFDETTPYTFNSGTNPDNYVIKYKAGTLTVFPNENSGGAVALNAVGYEDTYDGRAHEGVTQVTVTGDVAGNDWTYQYKASETDEWSDEIPAFTNAGSYTVYVKASTDNYVDVTGTADVTIYPAEVTVTADDTRKTYGEEDPALTATVTGLVRGESASLIQYTLEREAGEAVGKYDINPDGSKEQGNYTVSYVSGTFTISKAQVTITADSKTKTYGDDDPEFTGTVQGVIGEDDLNVRFMRTEEDEGKEDVDDKITITAVYDDDDNYDITVVDGTLTIVPASTNAVNPEAYAGKYDGEEHTITASALKDGSTLYYSEDGETWSETAPVFTDVGEYTVYVYATNHNYEDTEVVSALVTISKRYVTLTSASESKEYDGSALTNDEVTVGGDGFVRGEGAVCDVTGSQTKIGSSENAFTYELEAGTDEDNYDIRTVNGTLTITGSSGVTVTKTPDKTSVTIGSTVTWTVTVTNNGKAAARDLTLTDSIEGVTITAPDGVDYQLFDLEAGESIEFTVTCKPSKTGSYVNHVEVLQPKDSPDDEGEKIAEDDSDPVSVHSTPDEDVMITKTADVTSAEVGDVITYTVKVTNLGDDLDRVTVDDELDAAGSIDVGKLPVGVSYSEKNGRFTIKNLTENGRVTFTYTYTALDEDAGETLVNTVTARIDGMFSDDDSVRVKIKDVTKPTRPTVPTRPSLNTEDHVAYIIGYVDGTVRPLNEITRSEVAAIFFRLLTDDSRALYWSQTNDYSDVDAGDWFNNAVSTLSNAGVITGYADGTFRPNAPITRAEFAAIAARFSDTVYSGGSTFRDVPADYWAAKEISLAEHLGWVTGYTDGTFRPIQNITRAEAITMINRVLDRAVQESGLHVDMVIWSDNLPGAWYYEAIQEATNSHMYTRTLIPVSGQDFKYETWLQIVEAPDWAALEKAWSTANSK